MRELVEFRIREDYAAEFLPSGVGESVGYGIRKLVIGTSDPLFAEIGRLHKLFRAQGKYFFSGREYRRTYSRRELAEATLLHVWPRKIFQPAGEECGTIYDDLTACDYVFSGGTQCDLGESSVLIPASTCGVGARQVTPLFLDGRRIPSSVDFAQTIAGEVVVSTRVVELFRDLGFRGAEFEAVRLSDRHGMSSHRHFQLKVLESAVELDSETRAGEDPFDEQGYGHCPRDHIAGLNLLSEVWVVAATVPEVDLMATRQMIGVRRGLLRPRPILLLSSRAWRAVHNANLKGLAVEVAHVR
jgi:hypothetical protein